MRTMTPVQELGAFAGRTTFADLPAEVAESARLRVLDTIGVALAAWTADAGNQLLGVIAETGGAQQASPIGLRERYPLEQAAFLSGTLAHSLDFDDTHMPSILHPSAIIVSTALAVAQGTGRSGREILAAAVAGYEIAVRLGMAAYDPNMRNSVFFEKGLHGASIVGAIAGAAVASKLFGASEDEITHAMGIAASMGSGLLEANRTGGTVKQIHGGWACHSAVWAARLAHAGFTAPPTVFEGRFGLFYALCDNRFDAMEITRDLGARWETSRIVFKPYPANHFTHAGIDAALAIRAEFGPLRPDDVERIDLGVASSTLRTIAEPREVKVRPVSGYAARFSGPFTVAVALRGGGGLGVSLDDFTDTTVKDQTLLRMAEKVHCYADEACDQVFPHHFPAVLRVQLRDGRSIEKRVMENRGSHLRPLGPEEVLLKFQLNAKRWLDDDATAKVAQISRHFEEVESIEPLVAAWARV